MRSKRTRKTMVVQGCMQYWTCKRHHFKWNYPPASTNNKNDDDDGDDNNDSD